MACTIPSSANATKLYYVVQDNCTDLPANPVWKKFAVTGGVPAVTRDLLQSSTLNGSPEIDYARLGSLSVTGDHAVELAHGVHDDLIASAMQSDWSTPSTSLAASVALTVVGGVVTATIAGIDLTASATQGSLIRFTDLLLGSNAEPFEVVSAEFATDTVLQLAEIKDANDPVTGRAEDESGTSDVTFSKRITIGTTRKFIAVLAEFTDLEVGTRFDLVTGAEITGFNFDGSVNSIVTGTLPTIGKMYTPNLELADLPAGSTFKESESAAPYTGIDGRVSLDGAKLALVASITCSLDRGATGSFEYGSKYISHISYETATNSVSAESRFRDYDVISKFVAETPVSVTVAHKIGDSTKALSFNYPVALISEGGVTVGTGDNVLNIAFQPFTSGGTVPSLEIHSID